jgi:hypothetical protein
MIRKGNQKFKLPNLSSLIITGRSPTTKSWLLQEEVQQQRSFDQQYRKIEFLLPFFATTYIDFFKDETTFQPVSVERLSFR